MLCFPYWELQPREQNFLWKDDNQWAAQEKINGVRLILYFVRGVGVFAHSRTQHRLEDHLLFKDFIPDFTATVDTEAIVNKSIDTRPYTTKGEVTGSSLQSTVAVLRMKYGASRRLQLEQDAPLVFHAFDITNWDGQNLKARKLCERLAFLSDFQKAIRDQGVQYFVFPPIRFQGKRAFFNEVVERGGEGIVLKNLDSQYEDSSSRVRNGWIKVKKSKEFYAFVTGFARGKPTSKLRNQVAFLEFSVKTPNGDRVIAKIASLPWLLRKKVSHYNPKTDEVELHPGAYGRVALIRGQEFSHRACRLSHAKIDSWCGTMTAEMCVYSGESISPLGWVPEATVGG